MLQVRLIGMFDIRCNGQPLKLSSRAAQSLFAYLILTAGTTHRREKLAGMFWPDTSETKARTYLRNELWRIRKALSSQSMTDYLIVDDLYISFNKHVASWLDAKSFQEVSNSSSAEELMNALSNCEGELLPGFYDEWIVQEREHLQVLYEQKMVKLLEMLAAEKRWQESVKWAEHWIAQGQGAEEAYRFLIMAYDALGNQAKVASVYQRCVQDLRELGLEPSEHTRSLAFKRTYKLHIPIPLTSFIGREQQLKEVADLLSNSRLVTLTGSGGVGKTRLAIQVVADLLDRFPDGIWFLDLAPLNDSSLVTNTLTDVLGLHESVNSKLPVTEVLINYLRSRTALIVFDNCEHLIDASAQLGKSLLTSCVNLSILATSREALRVAGEIPYRVPSLEIPRSDFILAVDVLSNMESVRLFAQRATVVSPGFMINFENVFAVAQICQRLDGIPLAIELAAARTKLLTVDQILKRLDDRFNLLRSGLRTALPRHQTLRAMIEWSFDLLSEKERLLFRRLGVFAGGWTLEAAEALCSGNGIEQTEILELLSQLVDKSLVLPETVQNGVRYRALETIRHYALEQFRGSDEEEDLRLQHLKYFLQFSEQAEAALRGHSQVGWMTRLEIERENIRAALGWADATDVEAGLYLSGRLDRFWEHFDLREGARWLAKFLEKPESKSYPLARAKALCAQASMMFRTQEFNLARLAAQECLDLYRATGDKCGEIDGLLALALPETIASKALKLHQRALDLSRSLGDQWREARVLVELSWSIDDFHRGTSYLEKAVKLFKRVGDLELAAAHMIHLGNYELLNGNFGPAQKWLDEAVEVSQKLNITRLKRQLLYFYGTMALIKGDYETANAQLEEAASISESLGDRWSLLWTQARLGYIALRRGNLIEARDLLTATALAFQKDQFANGVLYALEGIASLNVVVDKLELAASLIGWADATREKIGDYRPKLEQTDIDQDIKAIISTISRSAFEEAYDMGRVMTLNEAVAVALEESV